jgi:2'-5' RNA ligase
VRTFFAVDIEVNVRMSIRLVIDEFYKVEKNIKWAKPENIHITIYFFGEVQVTDLNELELILKNAVKGLKPFTVTIKGISAFPSLERPRVIWIGVQNPTRELNAIYDGINRGLKETGLKIKRDVRGFTPHLTIGRIKGKYDKRIINKIQDKRDMEFGTFQIKNIVLYQSILRREGPIYKSLKIFNF